MLHSTGERPLCYWDCAPVLAENIAGVPLEGTTCLSGSKMLSALWLYQPLSLFLHCIATSPHAQRRDADPCQNSWYPKHTTESQGCGQAGQWDAPKPVLGGPNGAEGSTEAVCKEADCLKPLTANTASRKPFGPGRLRKVSRVRDCTAPVLFRPRPVPNRSDLLDSFMDSFLSLSLPTQYCCTLQTQYHLDVLHVHNGAQAVETPAMQLGVLAHPQ